MQIHFTQCFRTILSATEVTKLGQNNPLFFTVNLLIIRGVASSKQVRGPQHNMLAIANVNQYIETALKQDKSEGAMAPLGPIVATPVFIIITSAD